MSNSENQAEKPREPSTARLLMRLLAFVLILAAILFIAAGAGYLLTALGFHRGGQQHPLFYAGSLLMVVGYSVWAIWLGLLLLTGALATGVA